MEKIIRSSSVAGARRLAYKKSLSARSPESTTLKDEDGTDFQESVNENRDVPSLMVENSYQNQSQQLVNDLLKKIDALSLDNERLLQANREVEERLIQIEEKTVEEAKIRGYKEGEEEARSEVEKLIEQFNSVYIKFNSGIETVFSEIRSQATDVGFAVACKIMGEKLLTKEGVAAIVAEVCNSIRDESKLKVFVCQRDFELLGTITEDFNSEDRIQLLPDNRIGVGGCRVESTLGTWDGRLESQLRILRKTLESTTEGNNS